MIDVEEKAPEFTEKVYDPKQEEITELSLKDL